MLLVDVVVIVLVGVLLNLLIGGVAVWAFEAIDGAGAPATRWLTLITWPLTLLLATALALTLLVAVFAGRRSSRKNPGEDQRTAKAHHEVDSNIIWLDRRGSLSNAQRCPSLNSLVSRDAGQVG